MSALFAYLHHLAAFTLVASLACEWVLMRGELTVGTARRLQLADLMYGVSAGVIVVVGILRVVYFEKGASYYQYSAPFIAKMTLFILVGLLSIYPTLQFARWGKARKQGRAPAPAALQTARIRAAIRLELALIVPLILCAVLMAKGIGHLG